MCVYVRDTLLSPEPCAKVLVITIGRCLTFSNRVSNLRQKAAKQLLHMPGYPDTLMKIPALKSMMVLLKVTLIFAHLYEISVEKIEMVQERTLE